MSRIFISDSGYWKLKFSEQDVRGYEALDAEGNHVGEVVDMIIDTTKRRVDAIRLEDGTEYPAIDISIGDGVVYLASSLPDHVDESVTVYDDYGLVVERERVDGEPKHIQSYEGEEERLWRTLVRVEAVDGDNVHLVLGGWAPSSGEARPVVPRAAFPDALQGKVREGERFFSWVNLGARRIEDLSFNGFEFAPLPNDVEIQRSPPPVSHP